MAWTSAGTLSSPHWGYMMDRQPRTIDEYLDGLSDEMRNALESLRKRVRKLVPEAEECIGYCMPTFRLHGRNFVHFAAFKNHCSFFPGAAIVESFQGDLEGFKTSKGTIQFLPEKPIPGKILEKIIRARLAEEAERAAERASKAKRSKTAPPRK